MTDAPAQPAEAQHPAPPPAAQGVEIEVQPVTRRPAEDDRIIAAVTANMNRGFERMNSGIDRVVAAIQNAQRPVAAAAAPAAPAPTVTSTANHTENDVAHTEHKEVHTSSSGGYFWSTWSWPVRLILAVLLVFVLLKVIQPYNWDPVDEIRDTIANLGSTPSNMCNGRGAVIQHTGRGTTRYLTGC